MRSYATTSDLNTLKSEMLNRFAAMSGNAGVRVSECASLNEACSLDLKAPHTAKSLGADAAPQTLSGTCQGTSSPIFCAGCPLKTACAKR